MRVALLTIGARGDTEPFLALAVRLAQMGHSVKLGARPDFAPLAEDYRVEFAPLGRPYRQFITGAARASAIGSGHVLRQLRYAGKQRAYLSDGVNDDAWRAAQGADAIIYKYSWISGYTVAKKLGVPCAAAMPFPLTRTSAFPTFLFGRGINRGRLSNRLAWDITDEVVWQLLRRQDAALRRDLGLRPLPVMGPLAQQQKEEMPVYYLYSPVVLPRPVDWPARMHVTGYCSLDPPPGWQPPPELLDFLRSGPPPVSIGFGSMVSGDSQATLTVVLRALELSGQRGVLLSGWADLGANNRLPANVLRVDAIPHRWLFPHLRAVVHHGGAGTTGAAARAGVPSVIVPVAADQPSWGRVVHSLGIGPAPLPFPTLTAKDLAAAIHEAVNNTTMHLRATKLAQQIQTEDGPTRTIELFLRHTYAGDPLI